MLNSVELQQAKGCAWAMCNNSMLTFEQELLLYENQDFQDAVVLELQILRADNWMIDEVQRRGIRNSKKNEDDREAWDPEKDLQIDQKRIITPDEFLSGRVELISDLRLVRFLAENPKAIFGLSSREFEEFVAELLSKMGYRARLGPRGHDHGVDVFAERDRDVGPELVLVQCKKFAPDRKISEPIVKQLATDVRDRKASRGLVVTTSAFSKPALQYIEEWKYILSGADYDKLISWFKKIKF